MNTTLKKVGSAALVAAAISGFSGCMPKTETPAGTARTPVQDTARSLVVDTRLCSPKNTLVMRDNTEMARDNPWFSRYTAAISLGDSCDARAITPLVSLLEDKHVFVRASALFGLARILGALREDSAMAPLALRFERRFPAYEKLLVPGTAVSHEERVRAASSLSSETDMVSVSVLKGATNDDSAEVRHAAESALRALSYSLGSGAGSK